MSKHKSCFTEENLQEHLAWSWGSRKASPSLRLLGKRELVCFKDIHLYTVLCGAEDYHC